MNKVKTEIDPSKKLFIVHRPKDHSIERIEKPITSELKQLEEFYSMKLPKRTLEIT